MKPPVIVLIRPQMGENFGAVARAMANFGLNELRLVAPRDGWPNLAAEATAAGAVDILAAAKVYPDTASALADVTRAYATTARPRELEKRVVTPEVAISEMDPRMGPEDDKIALVFGPERTGITNEDLSWCDTIVTIPTTEHASLNLAQSVVVMAYEYRKQWTVDSGRTTSPLSTAYCPPSTAPLAQYEHLFRQLECALDEAEFFKVPEKKPHMWLNIKTMLLRGRFTEQEIRTMHGIFRALFEKG